MARLVGGGRPWFAWGCGLREKQGGRWPREAAANAVVGIPGKGPRLLPHPFK